MLPRGKVERSLLALGLCIFGLVIFRALQLIIAYNSPVEAFLVLGGTPNREIFVAKLAKQTPPVKVLISGGSESPCIWLIFEKHTAPKDNVWMERCSHNTFENFYYSTPILESWGVHKVLLITDKPQDERALPMAKLILGAHGMWVNLMLVPNSGGQASRYPVAINYLAGAAWGIASQLWQPHCKNLIHLPDVNMSEWYQKGFYCAPQAEVGHFRSNFQ
jgi:uncharacterized SAM-binding protein YcdF (DUF218 family)